eukprot:m.80392 g.80392  ORF g.80392 m.80392 type:complete len:75 (-) comp50689_c0_seq7:2460-2684(-)
MAFPFTRFLLLLLVLERIAMVCWVFHYAKRLYETVFVHRFSHATMPIRNIFKVTVSLLLFVPLAWPRSTVCQLS